jgi:hypothetical protein
VPPPGAGVVTVKFILPGPIALAGTEAVNWVVLTKVVCTAAPFTSTTLFEVKLVPVKVAVNAVLMGPLFGLMEVRVGAGGLTMLTESEFDSGGVAVALLTVILATPAVVSKFAGTCDKRYVELRYEVVRGALFHSTIEFAVNPVPVT